MPAGLWGGGGAMGRLCTVVVVHIAKSRILQRFKVHYSLSDEHSDDGIRDRFITEGFESNLASACVLNIHPIN